MFLNRKVKNSLKSFDSFKTRVSFMISRKIKGDKDDSARKFSSKMGSIYGGMSTIALYFSLLYIFGYGVIDLFKGTKDMTSSKIVTNNFLPGENQILMKEYAFLPQIEIKLIHNDEKTIKNLTDMGLVEHYSKELQLIKFNRTELNKYMAFALTFEHTLDG